jgi:Sulfotransferase domain
MNTEHRIAMWSGPRNISTAMMRSWGNRPDTYVCDEPFYAHYLLTTGNRDHPGYAETIANHETDWRKVVSWLIGPIPEGKTVFYQKHMAHHILPDMDLDWVDSLTNCLLIREPCEMLTSLADFLPAPSLEDTGLPHQLRLFGLLRAKHGEAPPVIDAKDVLEQPRRILGLLCEKVRVPFTDKMFQWEAGLRPTDGSWAPYWYEKVAQTTSFGRYHLKRSAVPESLLPLLEQCEEIYSELFQARLS